MPDLTCPVTGNSMASWNFRTDKIYLDKTYKAVEFAGGCTMVWAGVRAFPSCVIVQRVRVDAPPELIDGCFVFDRADWDKRRVAPTAALPLPPPNSTRYMSGDALSPRLWLTMSNNGDAVGSFGWQD